MLEKDREELFMMLEITTLSALKELREAYMGKTVKIVAGSNRKARGRLAVIDGIIIENGEPLFCCMVIRLNSDPRELRFVNNEAWTRAYRRWEDFEIVEETV
jgi:hypothetical protein